MSTFRVSEPSNFGARLTNRLAASNSSLSRDLGYSFFPRTLEKAVVSASTNILASSGSAGSGRDGNASSPASSSSGNNYLGLTSLGLGVSWGVVLTGDGRCRRSSNLSKRSSIRSTSRRIAVTSSPIVFCSFRRSLKSCPKSRRCYACVRRVLSWSAIVLRTVADFAGDAAADVTDGSSGGGGYAACDDGS